MANLCDFSMKVVGNSEEDIKTFVDMMSQNGTIYMGRGAEVEMDKIEEDDGKYSTVLNGWCKWSVQSALINNAISMRKEPETWSFGKTDVKTLRFVTLYEACKELDLDMEVYSSEPGMGFQEHKLYLYEDETLIEECVDYTEEYDEEADEWKEIGGFEWDFEI